MGGGPVIPLTLAQVAEITGGRLHGEPTAVVTGEVVIDSRRAGPGGLFAAVAGERSDGHDFAAAALAAGATAVLATRPVPVPSVLVADVPAEERARVIVEPDRAAAITQAVALAAPGDVIVVAGKGHETGQYVAGAVLPFDDRKVTAAALERAAKDQAVLDPWAVDR